MSPGPVVPPDEYARYCRYLVARYGAGPTIYLVGADGSGYEPQLPAGGAEIWSAGTATGSRPDCTTARTPTIARLPGRRRGSTSSGARPATAASTLLTGSRTCGATLPVKAVANGEPTYEGTRGTVLGADWWQGHEAWSNLCAGGTMGVVYGAASLWQWVLRPGEPGFTDYFLAPGCSWREALEFPGATYPGVLGRLLAGLPTTDMRPGWSDLLAARCLVVPGVLCIIYAEHVAPSLVTAEPIPAHYRVYDPRTGEQVGSGVVTGPALDDDDQDGPRVFVFYDGFSTAG